MTWVVNQVLGEIIIFRVCLHILKGVFRLNLKQQVCVGIGQTNFVVISNG